VLALALGLLALTGAYVGLSLAGPSDGALRAIPAWNGLLVVAVEDEPGNDALRLGDVIVAVEGRSVEAWMEALSRPDVAPARWQVGQRSPTRSCATTVR